MRSDRERRLAPSGCRRCGLREHDHGTWATASGRHVYEPPTERQIRARMQSRRLTGGRVMCCEDCPPQTTCGSVMCTVRFLLWNHPWNTRNRTDALHHLFCVSGNGYRWVNGQLVDVTGWRPDSDDYGLKGVEVDPDDPMFAKYQQSDPDYYAELKAAKDAERAELQRVRDHVEELARTPGPLTRGEPYEEDDTHSLLATIPPDALPDWQAAAEEIRAFVEPVWAQRRAERAAVEAAPAVADVLHAAARLLDKRASQATPGPWWRPLDVRTKSSVFAALPEGEPGEWRDGFDPYLKRRENVGVLRVATWSTGRHVRPRSGRDLEWAAMVNPLLGPPLAKVLRREANRIAQMFKHVQPEQVNPDLWEIARVVVESQTRPPSIAD